MQFIFLKSIARQNSTVDWSKRCTYLQFLSPRRVSRKNGNGSTNLKKNIPVRVYNTKMYITRNKIFLQSFSFFESWFFQSILIFIIQYFLYFSSLLNKIWCVTFKLWRTTKIFIDSTHLYSPPGVSRPRDSSRSALRSAWQLLDRCRLPRCSAQGSRPQSSFSSLSAVPPPEVIMKFTCFK